MKWSYEAPKPSELPGANLIFDALSADRPPLRTGAADRPRRPRPGSGGRAGGDRLRRLRVPVLRGARGPAARAAAARRVPALPGPRQPPARAGGRPRRRGGGRAGRVLGDARRAVRRPGAARGPAPVGARGAARARPRALRRRPPLAAVAERVKAHFHGGVRAGVVTTPTAFAGRSAILGANRRPARSRKPHDRVDRRPADGAPPGGRHGRGAARALPRLRRGAARLRPQRARRARRRRGDRAGGVHARLAARGALRPGARQRADVALPDRPPRDHRHAAARLGAAGAGRRRAAVRDRRAPATRSSRRCSAGRWRPRSSA